MAALTISGVVRKILSENLELPADEVLRRAKARGLKAPDKSIRANIHNLKSVMKKSAAAGVLVAKSAARETVEPKAAPVAATTVSVAVKGTTDLAGVLENVALVNKIVGICGGIDNARQTAEAVQACGGVEAFLKHLELVASIRPAK